MLQFLSLGSGSSGNCYLLQSDDSILMIDAGIDSRLMKQYFDTYGINRQLLCAVLLTHDHIDHAKTAGIVSRDHRLDVYATRQTHHAVSRNRRITTAIDSTHTLFITHEESFDIGQWHITPFAVPHDSHTNTGYRIRHGATCFAIVTDVGHITPTIIRHLQGVNHLVVEANYDPQMLLNGRYPFFLKRRIAGPTGHLSNAETAQLLAECESDALQNVWLCHLSEENNQPQLAVDTVRQHYLRLTTHPHPSPDTQHLRFTLTPLNRQKPTGPFLI